MRLALESLSAALVLGTISLSHAQTITGTILGTVLDSAGGAVSQAHILITEQNIGRKREMTTNNQGGYLATFLPVGTYTVAVEKPGFRKVVITGTVLQVDQPIRLDISLEVGAVNQ